MTKEDYIKAIREIDSEINKLKELRKDATDLYIKDNREYFDGDRVILETEKSKRESVVFSAVVDYRKDIEYKFKKVKKDGTMSGVNDYAYYGTVITRAPSPQLTR